MLHYIRISGSPDYLGRLPKTRLNSPSLNNEKIREIKISKLQVYFPNAERDLRSYDHFWEITSNLCFDTLWIKNAHSDDVLEERPVPILNLLVKKDENSTNYECKTSSNWHLVNKLEDSIEIKLKDPISEIPVYNKAIIYIILAIKTGC